jgi:BCD family chlorophyll transporter-like MFS transporter
MKRPGIGLMHRWGRLGPQWLALCRRRHAELPLPRLLRLSLFQVSVGMATALMVGTLNRVLIVELGVAAWLVALMVALPLVFSPFRALLGFKLRPPPLGLWLAPRALHLDGLADAVRGPGDHAVFAAAAGR